MRRWQALITGSINMHILCRWQALGDWCLWLQHVLRAHMFGGIFSKTVPDYS